MEYLVEAVDHSSQSAMLHFLREHENYSLFLLGNFENHGLTLSEAPYSGNFKLIRTSDKIVAVFCLTKKGSLLIESTVREPIFESLLASCQEESIFITGVIGNWDFCHSFWNYLKERKIIQQELFHSKETLYSVDLSRRSPLPQSNVRLLTQEDYTQWKPLRLDYIQEEGFPNELSDDQLLELFLDKVKKKIAWGYFLENKLVSIADLNAKSLDLGQVGGVYTDPNFRQKGFSKAVMRQLLTDVRRLHAIRKLIIFTDEKNFPARKLYESLGGEHVGYFALLFGSH